MSRGWLALVKKELGSFFTRPVIYVQLGFNLHEQMIQGYLSVVHYIFMLFICFLSVHFFTEEKKQGTLSLLLSSPLSSWQLVLGKFFGGALFLLFLCGVASLFPLGLSFYIDFQWMPFFVSIFGLFLVLLVYMSVAMMISATTTSSLLAPFLSLVVILLLLLLSTGQYFASSTEARLFFSYLSFERHFGFFRIGHFSLSSALFFTSLSVFSLAACERLLESHRWS